MFAFIALGISIISLILAIIAITRTRKSNYCASCYRGNIYGTPHSRAYREAIVADPVTAGVYDYDNPAASPGITWVL